MLICNFLFLCIHKSINMLVLSPCADTLRQSGTRAQSQASTPLGLRGALFADTLQSSFMNNTFQFLSSKFMIFF